MLRVDLGRGLKPEIIEYGYNEGVMGGIGDGYEEF